MHLGLWAGLTTVGLIGAFTHFYMLLQVGMVFAVLLVSVPDNRFRLLLVLSGLSILGCDLAYIHALQAHTQLDFHNLWFSNDPGALQGAVKGFWKNGFSGSVKNAYVVLALGWIVLAWRRRVTAPVAPAQRPEADWLALMAVVVIIGVTLTGLAASLLFAPSFSDLNLQVALPWIWVLSAWLFDKVVRGGRRRDEVVVGLLTAVMLTGTLPAVVGRTLQRHEDYRGSAAYVAASPGCAGEEVPVIIPFRFGPSTPFFRRLAEQSFFGRYYQGGGRLRAWSPGELAFSADPELSSLFAARAQGRDACKVMAWGVHDIDQWRAEALARWIAKRADVAPAQVQVRIIPSWRRNGKSWAADGDGAFVFEVVRPKG